MQGEVVIPLREDEVRQATRELVAQGSKAVICFLQSHKNGTSEQRARDVCRDELKKSGHDIRCSPRWTTTRSARKATA